MYVWLYWVFVSVRGLSLVVASGGHSSSQCGDHSSSRCTGLSLSRPLLLRSTGSRRAGSVIVAHGPSCSAACGIFPDQGSNLRPLHWQADSQPLRHQGSPAGGFLTTVPPGKSPMLGFRTRKGHASPPSLFSSVDLVNCMHSSLHILLGWEKPRPIGSRCKDFCRVYFSLLFDMSTHFCLLFVFNSSSGSCYLTPFHNVSLKLP